MDEFSNHTDIEWHGSVGVVQYGSDRTQVCIFYNKAVHNPAKSTSEGRPIYEDRVFVRIHPPGERLNIIDRPATGEDKKRWPIQWQQFQQNKAQTPEGTPIEMLYPDQPSVAAALRASSVHTIEQCADLSAAAIDTIGMGAQRYSNDAKKYLEVANKGVGAAQLRRELEERDGQIRVLTRQIEQLKGEVNRLSSQQSGSDQLAKLQELLAGAINRPLMPPAGTVASDRFDVSTEQINATHPSTTVKPSRKRVKL
jgi:hypothetical protein